MNLFAQTQIQKTELSVWFRFMFWLYSKPNWALGVKVCFKMYLKQTFYNNSTHFFEIFLDEKQLLSWLFLSPDQISMGTLRMIWKSEAISPCTSWAEHWKAPEGWKEYMNNTETIKKQAVIVWKGARELPRNKKT